MGLEDELGRIAGEAAALAAGGERVAGVVATEPASGERVYLVAFANGSDAQSWLALDERGDPIVARERVRAAVSIAALCEVAEDSAGGGRLEALRSELLTLRLTEAPPGIAEAEEAALALESAIGSPPRVASPAYLDALGAATRRLERALGGSVSSPFGQAMQQAAGAVEALIADVERNYRRPLE